ncbi:MAG TPA: hypothetical protein VG936_12540 [Lacunisphaera sp.]|nr:hypothetical protein [Lacunisphaera sp.]
MKPTFSRLLTAATIAGLLLVVPRLSGQEIGAGPGPAAMSGGAEVLTRGPVHEAFAAVVNYQPQAGLIVNRQPPEPIEETPPDERPVGEDVAWIPGYWGWDDERNDFIWVSGTWRVLPPGRAWISGYWGDTGRGWQWTSGYWADASQSEVTYLPPPPETLERGPNGPAPGDNYEWSPGCWEWRDRGYAWRPGYWMQAQQDWVWTPSYYVWTPRGYVFVAGYWDYAPQDRGLLFAPVYYREYGRRYEYTPSVVLNLAILADFLFLRPDYCHYYFGDYYDARYENRGFFAEFSYQSSRRGYDPFYSYERWQHRDDRNWERQRREAFEYRRRHEDARPPRTWSGSTVVVNVNQYNNTRTGGGGGRRVTYAESVQQYARSNNTPVRIERTAATDRQREVQLAREMQQQRTQRRELEAQRQSAEIGGSRTSSATSSRQSYASRTNQSEPRREPARVELPKSPIVARAQANGRPPPPKQPAPQRREEAETRGSPRRPGTAANQAPAPERQQAIGQEQPSRPAVIGQDEAARQKAIQQEEQSRRQAAAQSEQERQRGARQQEIGRTQNSREQELARDQAAQQQEQARQRAIGQADQKRAVQSQEIGREPSRQQALARDQAAQKQRDAADAQARAQEQQKQAERLREERPGQDRQALAQQQRDQAKQQAQARQEQARNEQQRATDRAQEQQSKVAAQAREQQQRAGEDARARQALADAQEKRQQEQASQRAKEQESRVAEQARQRQQQAKEEQSRVAEQARQQQQQAQDQKARAAELAQQEQERARKQAESIRPQRQNLAPTGRVSAPPPPKKAPPPPKQKDQSDDDNRKKKDKDGG